MSLSLRKTTMQHNQFAPELRSLPLPIKTDADFSSWLHEQSSATAELAHLENGRARLLLSTTAVEQIARHDAETATMRLRVERAAAVVDDWRRQEAARQAEADRRQPERRKAHTKALAAREEAARLLVEVYAPAAATIRDALLRLAEIRAAIEAANAALPEGVEQIPHLDLLRGHPATPASWEERDEVFFVNPQTGEEAQPFPGSNPPAARTGLRGNVEVLLERHTRRVRVKQVGTSAWWPQPLERTVALPPARDGEPAYWPQER